MLKLKQMSLGPLGTNCYIVYKNKQALIIDPGGNANKIIDFLHQEGLTASAILLTHAHFDHIGAVQTLRTELGLDVYLHQNEQAWLTDPVLNRSEAFGTAIVTDLPERVLKPGKLEIDSIAFEVIHTPGHSPGSVSFIFEEEGFVVSGDVLFQHGIGRTDLPGGDMEQLEESIRKKLYLLDDAYTVYPGHGPETTIKVEKVNNPFVPNL